VGRWVCKGRRGVEDEEEEEGRLVEEGKAQISPLELS
jgi:hypothetical protein